MKNDGGNGMQFVKACDVKPGMRLAKPIYDRRGVLLYDRDIKITEPVMKSIEHFGLIGIYILEPAEPLPPLSEDDIQFEKHQTMYLFLLIECIEKIQTGVLPPQFHTLMTSIQKEYGQLDHLINFNQNLRSSDDFMYKHSINTAILVAMLSHALMLSQEEKDCLLAVSLLYSVGYSTVPKHIMDKGTDLSDEEMDEIQRHLENGYLGIQQKIPKNALPPKSMIMLEYYIFRNSRSQGQRFEKVAGQYVRLASIISVASMYDQLTAINVNHEPLSEIMAMQVLKANPEKYAPDIVDALADCIHIVPAGASVDLSNKTKGIVLVENEDDFMRPLILRIDNNQIYDLSNPVVFRNMQIVDIMKTMDNRIAIDENTLKLFKADKRITATADKFRRSAMRRREEARKRAEEQKLEGTAQRPTNTQVDTEEIRNLLAVSTERQLLSEQAGSGAVSAQTPAPAKKKKRKLM